MVKGTTSLQVRGRHVHEIRGGSGDPVLYLHSAMGEAFWLPHLERLAERYALHAPAHPGFLSSEGLDAIRDVEDYVDHYLAYLDALGWERVPVVGLSLGGWIAAELAARHPERVQKLVLADAVGLWIRERPIADLFAVDTRFPERLRELLFADPNGPAAQLVQPPGPGVELPDEVLENMMKAMTATAKVGWNPLLHDPKLEAKLPRVTAPTLVLWGAEDRVTPPEYGEKYAKLIPGAELETLPGCGHLAPFERPDAWADSVARFLG